MSYVSYRPGVPMVSFSRATTATEFRDILEEETISVNRPLIGHPIVSDDGTLSGGDFEATLPLTNMQTRDTTEVARTVNDSQSAGQFDLDLGADPLDWLIRAHAIFAHNLSKEALWKVTGSDESDFDPLVFDSGWVDAYRTIYPWDVLNPGEGGYPDGWPAATQPAGVPLVMFVPEGTACRYWRFEFDDTTNPDTYLEFGRLISCYAWQLGENFEVGAGLEVGTRTTIEETDGGALVIEAKPQRRTNIGTWPTLDEDEALVRVHDFKMTVGMSGQFLWVEKPGDLEHLHRGAFPAVMRRLTPLEYPAAYLYRKQAVEIMEEF